MNDDLIRIMSLIELVVLLSAGVAWQLSHRGALPISAWWVGWGFGYALVVVAVAIVINAFSGAPVTVGQRIVTYGLVPGVAWVLAWTSYAVAHSLQLVAEVRNLGEPPCNHPGCRSTRDHYRHLAGRAM